MRNTLFATVAFFLSAGCTRPGPRSSVALPDSNQLVQRAQAALDSNRGQVDPLKLTVREFRRQGATVEVVLRPESDRVQGGGGVVRMDSAGRVLFVRGFQ
jgi:hypothetical protein